GSHVLKGYASESKYGDAARALEIAAATPVPTPHYEARIEELRATVQSALPENAAHVCSHGDFEVGQLLQHDGDVTLLDFDELCSAPAALDVATYAAHAARIGGAPAALAAADALVETYGARPDGLQPYLAAASLLRA